MGTINEHTSNYYLTRTICRPLTRLARPFIPLISTHFTDFFSSLLISSLFCSTILCSSLLYSSLLYSSLLCSYVSVELLLACDSLPQAVTIWAGKYQLR